MKYEYIVKFCIHYRITILHILQNIENQFHYSEKFRIISGERLQPQNNKFPPHFTSTWKFSSSWFQIVHIQWTTICSAPTISLGFRDVGFFSRPKFPTHHYYHHLTFRPTFEHNLHNFLSIYAWCKLIFRRPQIMADGEFLTVVFAT